MRFEIFEIFFPYGEGVRVRVRVSKAPTTAAESHTCCHCLHTYYVLLLSTVYLEVLTTVPADIRDLICLRPSVKCGYGIGWKVKKEDRRL